jgi:predicted enzyme involved in methoxymalonyl-ACP biosynthesis
MISVVTCRKTARAWDIDLWLMSCRVLKRRVEEAVLHEIARHARAAGASELRGRYIPTSRNGMVAEHYAQLGFRCSARHADGTTEWSMALADLAPVDLPMSICATALPPAGESRAAVPGSAGRSLVAA